MRESFSGAFNGLTVLVTGQTGFKGSWLSLWLQALGANVIGYSLPPPTQPNNFILSDVATNMTSILGDIRDYNHVKKIIDEFQPAVIFHLAAQSIVLHGLENSKDTFDTNVSGTINLLEAAMHCPSVKAMVIVTSDKCYANQEWMWGYRENDHLGGLDPYSASKSMAEIAIAAYRHSFCKNNKEAPAIASARAGNVIGGGDFSCMRIVPDSIKSLRAKEPILIRNPNSVRPWLYVLDALSGYLCLAANILLSRNVFAEAWNFGPLEHQAITVHMLIEKIIAHWGNGKWLHANPQECFSEMGLLRLNWDKAANRLNWKPAYHWFEAIKHTVDWYKAYDSCRQANDTAEMHRVSINQIIDYTKRASHLGIPWAAFSEQSSFCLT